MSFETIFCLLLFPTRQINIYIFPGKNSGSDDASFEQENFSHLVWLSLTFSTVIITLNLCGLVLGSLVNTLGLVKKMRNLHDFIDAHGKPQYETDWIYSALVPQHLDPKEVLL